MDVAIHKVLSSFMLGQIGKKKLTLELMNG